LQTDISQGLDVEPKLSGKEEGGEQQRPMQKQQARGRQTEQQHLCTAMERPEDPRDT